MTARQRGYQDALNGAPNNNPYPRYCDDWHEYAVGYAEGTGERKRKAATA